MKYGARHLKRAIDRSLVHPLSNLMATDQVDAGDWIEADVDLERRCLVFTKEAEKLEQTAMFNIVNDNFRLSPIVAATAVQAETVRAAAMVSPASNKSI